MKPRRRGIGRPAKAEPFRSLVAQLLTTEPELLSVEILRRAKLAGYSGGKTALYDLVNAIRPTTVRPLVDSIRSHHGCLSSGCHQDVRPRRRAVERVRSDQALRTVSYSTM